MKILEFKEVEVNDDIEKLPKEIKYGRGLWQPEILLKLNNKREKYSQGGTYCYYDNFPGGIYLWEIRYKNVSENQYINANSDPFVWDHLVGVGITLSDAVFGIEKGLRTKYYDDLSIPNEETKKYFEGKLTEEEK